MSWKGEICFTSLEEDVKCASLIVCSITIQGLVNLDSEERLCVAVNIRFIRYSIIFICVFICTNKAQMEQNAEGRW